MFIYLFASGILVFILYLTELLLMQRSWVSNAWIPMSRGVDECFSELLIYIISINKPQMLFWLFFWMASFDSMIELYILIMSGSVESFTPVGFIAQEQLLKWETLQRMDKSATMVKISLLFEG